MEKEKAQKARILLGKIEAIERVVSILSIKNEEGTALRVPSFMREELLSETKEILIEYENRLIKL